MRTPFRRFWWATAIDSVGDGAFAAAVPLLAVTVTRDPRLVSLVAAATYLPWLVLSLPIGALVDRSDRIGVLSRAQVVQAGAAAALAALVAVHAAGVAVLVVFAFLLGVGEVAAGNAAQAALPELVAPGELHRANGRLNAIMTGGALFVGPPVGSLLFGVAAGLPFALDAVSFAGSVVLLAALPRRPRNRSAGTTVRRAVADGLHWLRGDRLLRTLAVLLGVNNFCGQFGTATLVLLATRTLHVSAAGFGVLLATAAVGAVLGGLVDAWLVATLGEQTALLGAMAGLAAGYLGMGLAPNGVVLGAFMATNGFFVSLWNVVTVSLRQELVPRELLGRVNSVYRMVGWGFMPLGAVVGGLVADRFGLRAPYELASGIRGVVFVLVVPALVSALRAARAPRVGADRS